MQRWSKDQHKVLKPKHVGRPILQPKHDNEEYFRNAQGLQMLATKWLPAEKVEAVVFIAHGFGEYGGRYHEFARRLTAINCAVFALDHQGHGLSEGERAYWTRFDDLVHDFIQFIQKYDSQHDASLPRFLFGHSMGGTVATLVANRRIRAWSGVILSAPALTVDPKLATPFLIKLATYLSRKAPKMALKKIPLKFLSRNKANVRKYKTDPLIYKGGMKARPGIEMFHALKACQTSFSSIDWPFLVCHGDADKVTSPDGSRDLFETASSPDKTHRSYDGMYHELFQELEPDTEKVYADILDWLTARKR
eukprot:GILJ01001176.1.p1 GENE.GILJ01001176.1~~GILJ01001176.1.p1  ORF type:complete len:323 (-),score=35.94 GILJ01001176.1:93-1013(-)